MKIHIVTNRRLDQANIAVTRELIRHGFYDEHTQAVDTFLVLYGNAYGWQWYGSSGEIHIPRISLARISHLWKGGYTSLRDVIRHEFAHAIADTHRGLFRSQHFSDAFHPPHCSDNTWDYDPEQFVSDYATTSPSEDYAETFMFYLRHNARLPRYLATPTIEAKWRFIDNLALAIQGGIRRWE